MRLNTEQVQTIRHAATEAFGAGVKVWVFNGEIYDRQVKDDAGGLVRRPASRDGVEARS